MVPESARSPYPHSLTGLHAGFVVTTRFAEETKNGWRSGMRDLYKIGLALLLLAALSAGLDMIPVGPGRCTGSTPNSWVSAGGNLAFAQAQAPSAITAREDRALEEHCDRSAGMDLEKLAAAMDRLKNELLDLNCDPDSAFLKLWQSDGARMLGYIPGPYYGWRGTTAGCANRIRIDGDEIQSCSLRGRSPDGKPGTRRIFRVNVKTLEPLPATTGPCYGATIGDDDHDFSVGSMIEPKGCALKKPPTKKLTDIMKDADQQPKQ
jgi:hypothetical protein